MKRFRIWGNIVAVLAAIVAGFYYLDDRREIRHQLYELAEIASTTGAETDVDRLARAARISSFFTDDVVVRRSEDNSAFVGGRRGIAAAAIPTADHQVIRVSIEHVNVTLADDSHARADMTVVVSLNSPDAESVDLRKVTATMRKEKGEWLIAQAEVQPSAPR
jgi:ketosteroid isomerase-like protein